MTVVCPSCGGKRVRPSRPRSWFERARRAVTAQVPFRCHSCDWRGWRPAGPKITPDSPRPVHGALTDEEIERLEPDGMELEGK